MTIREVVEKYYPKIEATSGTQALLQKEIDYLNYQIDKIVNNQNIIFELLRSK